MGRSEALTKEIDRLADKVRFLRTIWLAVLTGLVGLLFGISQNRISVNLLTEIFLYGGALIVTLLAFLITYEEKKRKKLIKELEEI